jgi:hypothetical protein
MIQGSTENPFTGTPQLYLMTPNQLQRNHNYFFLILPIYETTTAKIKANKIE